MAVKVGPGCADHPGMALREVGEIDSEFRGPAVSVRRVLTAVVAVVLAVCAGGLVWWQSQQVPVREYRDARVMAEAIGCQDTYVEALSSAATTAGQCLVDGVAVHLRTFRDQASALAWHDGVVFAAPQRPLAGIGTDYVVLSDDPATFAVVSEALG